MDHKELFIYDAPKDPQDPCVVITASSKLCNCNYVFKLVLP